MPTNPYQPPSADLADPEAENPHPPVSVRRACQLILGSLALGLLTLMPGIRPVTSQDEAVPFAFTAAFALIFGGLTVWLTVKLYRRKNWARWAMLAYLLLGWLLAGSSLNDDFVQSPIAGIIDIVCIAMEAVACWYIFLGGGAHWYAKLANRRIGSTGP